MLNNGGGGSGGGSGSSISISKSIGIVGQVVTNSIMFLTQNEYLISKILFSASLLRHLDKKYWDQILYRFINLGFSVKSH